MQREFYSLVVDEKTTEQNAKQLDMHAKHWSHQENKIATLVLASSVTQQQKQ
jgi:hypothetical protein